ncbi:hypothetical protein CKO_04638 [Citrobacter koseri ATCC BAA-895]|uniref:Uncharacterized protein n=1 Tax=Citrobacter koseri (strain ATCC BAA-895 / CDC 4225-83 / SGSC4696) TaxID=290338 RepID=A8AQC5_CITK8|nr:hypothetical protein CKO_04638 [Citrobacter koseri ATCC BAA-895]
MVIVNYANSRHCSTNWKRIKLSWKSIVKSWSATLPAAPSCWIPWRMIIVSCISTWRKAPAACCRNCLRNRTRSVTVWRSLKPVTIRRRSRCRVTIPKALPACCVVAQNATNRTSLRNFSGAAVAPVSSLLSQLLFSH